MKTSDTSPQKQSLWKKIGYVKESHMSEAQYRVGRQKSPGSAKGDKRGNVYNSLIQHRLVIPQQPKLSVGSSHEHNESAFDNLAHTNETHIDQAFQNMLKVLHAPQDELLGMQCQHSIQELNMVFTPNSDSKEQTKFQRIEQERDSGYGSSRQPTTFQRLHTLQQQPPYYFPTDSKPQFDNLVPSHDLPVHTPPFMTKYQKKLKKLHFVKGLISSQFTQLKHLYKQFQQGFKSRLSEDREAFRQMTRNFDPIYQELIQKITDQITKRVANEKPSRDTSSNDSSLKATLQQIQMQTIEIQSLKQALNSSQQRQATLQSRFNDLQARYRQLETTSNLKLQRTTDQNMHLQQQIKHLQSQHQQQRRIFRERLEKQRQNEEHRINQPSNTQRHSLLQKLKQRDSQIQLLRQQVADKCTTIQLLVQRLKQVEAQQQRQKEKQMYEIMLAQKDQVIQQLYNKNAENQAIQQEFKNRLQIYQMQIYTLQQDNFHFKQRIEAFDGQLADRLRQQRRLLTKQHMTRIAQLEDTNARLSDRIHTVSQQLTKERDSKSNSQKNPSKFVGARHNEDPGRHYSNRQEERRSVGSNDTHQLINVIETETNQYRPKYSSAIQKLPIPKLTSPIKRYQIPSPNVSSQYIGSLPVTGNLRYEAYSRDNTEYMDMHTNSQEQLFTPFYKQLNGTARPTKISRPQDNPSKVYQRNNMKIQTVELPINPTTNINSARYTFNPNKQVKKTTTPSYDINQPYMLSKNSSQSQFRISNQYIPTRDRPFANSRKELHSNRDHQPYMHSQKVDLGRLETQIESLTKQLRSQLQTVTRRINK